MILVLIILIINISSIYSDRIYNSPYPYSTQPNKLYIFNESSLEDHTLILPLQITQGVLARISSDVLIYRQSDPSNMNKKFEQYLKQWVPSIKLESSYTGYDIWLKEMINLGIAYDKTYENNIEELLHLFSYLFHGYVLCDCATESVNVGISIAAMYDQPHVLTICNTTTSIDLMSKLQLELFMDVRQKNMTWLVNNYFNQFNHRILTIQSPTKYTNLVDYSIFTGSITCYNNPIIVNDTCNLLENKMKSKSFPIFGWSDEFTIVSTASKDSGFVHASDWCMDMSVLTNINITTFKQKKPINTHHHHHHHHHIVNEQTNKSRHKVAFLMSDGDNLQFLLSVFPTDSRWFGSPSRGKTHIGWTISPALAEISPVTLKYLYEQQKVNKDGSDYFIAAPSGLGYTYPDLYSNAKNLSNYVNLTSEMLKKADLSMMNVIGSSNNLTEIENSMKPFLLNDQIDAIFYYPYADYSGLKGNITFVNNNKPIIGGRWNLWSGFESPSSLAKKLNVMSTNGTSSDGYSLIPVNAWSMNVSAILDCVNMLDTNRVEVVSPLQLVADIITNIKH